VILILSDEAVLDIEEAFLWYLEINPGIADKFENSLFTELEHIQSYSENFQARYKNIRVRFLSKFPYGVHYLIKDNETLLVVGVFHTSKDPKNWFDRIK
jgi:toxin ParE1/3/4